MHVARTFTKWRGTSCVKRPVLLLLLHGSVARTDKPLAINSIILVPAPYLYNTIDTCRQRYFTIYVEKGITFLSKAK